MDFHRFDPDLLAIRALLTQVSLDLKSLRLLIRLKGFPDQPRVPSGNPDGGQWTSREEGERSEEWDRWDDDAVLTSISDKRPPRDHNGPPGLLPPSKPTGVGALSRVLRAVAAVHPASRLLALAAGMWAERYIPDMLAAQDPPKTLTELQDAVGSRRPGYEVHHIVEQGPARQDSLGEDLLGSREHLISFPTLKHREITGWYSKGSPAYGGASPREYLRGRDWQTRYDVGIKALINTGVLRP